MGHGHQIIQILQLTFDIDVDVSTCHRGDHDITVLPFFLMQLVMAQIMAPMVIKLSTSGRMGGWGGAQRNLGQDGTGIRNELR